MKYIALYNGTDIIGFIVTEEQKAFLLEHNELLQFYDFLWTNDKVPPSIEDCVIVDGKLIVKNYITP